MSPSGAEVIRQIKSQIEEVDPSEVNGAVSNGNVFVALKGQRADGAAFSAEALERGAIAIVSEQPPPEPVAETAGGEEQPREHDHDAHDGLLVSP